MSFHRVALNICRRPNSLRSSQFILYNTALNLKRFKQLTNAMSSVISNQAGSIEKTFVPRDVKFKTPYGQIACLEWGNREAPHKILCLHGWLDNAGSFERLVPFILKHENNHQLYHIVAMDMVGHGLSSHLPPGSMYTMSTAFVEMRRVTQELGWDKMTILAHSLGAHQSYMYSCIYPDQVKNMISIDLTHPLAHQTQNWHIFMSNCIDDFFKNEHAHREDPATNTRVPVYSEADAIKRLMEGHSQSLSREAAEVMLKRGAKKQRWGYTFTRDLRLRNLSPEIRPDNELMLKLCKSFRANLFLLRASRSPYHRPEEIKEQYYELFRENCPIFQEITLDGTHHLHMNTPEEVACEINKFLKQVFTNDIGDSGATVLNTKSKF